MTESSSVAIYYVPRADRPVTTPRTNLDFADGGILKTEFSQINGTCGNIISGEYRLWFGVLMDTVVTLMRQSPPPYATERWKGNHAEALAWVQSTDYYVGSFSFIVGDVLGWSVSETRRILLTDPRGIKRRLTKIRNAARHESRRIPVE